MKIFIGETGPQTLLVTSVHHTKMLEYIVRPCCAWAVFITLLYITGM